MLVFVEIIFIIINFFINIRTQNYSIFKCLISLRLRFFNFFNRISHNNRFVRNHFSFCNTTTHLCTVKHHEAHGTFPLICSNLHSFNCGWYSPVVSSKTAHLYRRSTRFRDRLFQASSNFLSMLRIFRSVIKRVGEFGDRLIMP